MEKKPLRSKRFEKLAERPVNQEPFIKPWPETSLIAVASPLMIGDVLNLLTFDRASRYEFIS